MAKGVYTDERGRRRPWTDERSGRRTLYNSPPRHPRLAADVMISSPARARESVGYLEEDWGNATTRAQKRDLVWAANQAANRAKASTKRRELPLSEAERREMLEVSGIFRGFVDLHKGTY